MSLAGGGWRRLARPKSRSLTPLAVEHDVAGLEIPMDDAGAMRGGERVGDVHRRKSSASSSGNLSRRKPRRQRLAVEEFHHQEVDAVLVADVVAARRYAGCDRAAIARASRSNRWRVDGSAVSSWR